MDDDELKKDDELEDASDDELLEDDLVLGGKGRKKGDDLDPALDDDIESIDDLAALEDEEDEPYDDIDRW
jgi:hypothetical protein